MVNNTIHNPRKDKTSNNFHIFISIDFFFIKIIDIQFKRKNNDTENILKKKDDKFHNTIFSKFRK